MTADFGATLSFDLSRPGRIGCTLPPLDVPEAGPPPAGLLRDGAAVAAVTSARAYPRANGGPRRRVLVPDSAHGTNPATAAMAGFDVVSIPSDVRGNMDLEILASALDDTVAA